MTLLHKGSLACNTRAVHQLTDDYVLSALRSGALSARLIANEADTIGIALRSNLISPRAAILWARDAGVLDLVGQEDIEAAAAEIMGTTP
jgi:hypothetical protein